MELEKIRKLALGANFEELICAAFLVCNDEQHIKLINQFRDLWDKLREEHKQQTKRSNRLWWITTHRGPSRRLRRLQQQF